VRRTTIARNTVAKKPVQKANSRQFVGVLVIVAAVGVAALGYALSHSGQKVMIVDPRIPAGAAEGHLMGNANAPVQVLEFGDFECPACGNFATVTEPDVRTRLINTGVVAFRYFDFPLAQHKNTWTAHLAAACADDQGKFWEMHDRLYAGQDEWSDLVGDAPDPLSTFRRYAKELGMDVKSWENCVTTQKYAARIKGNQAEGMRRNVAQTPTLIIGNRQVNLVTYDEFKKLVDQAQADASKAKADSAGKAGARKKGAAR
jgi:protein-disulfide isomerase